MFVEIGIEKFTIEHRFQLSFKYIREIDNEQTYLICISVTCD